MAKPDEGPDAGSFPFSAQDAMAFFQKMWNPLGVPIPGMPLPGTGAPGAPGNPGEMPFVNPAMMFAALDPVEIERKISELRVIESWLSMSLNIMQMSIKTLELQKASLEAFRSAHKPAAPAPASRGKGGKGQGQ